MRVVKTASERRNEILDVAGRLFATKGFGNTSILDIQKETGIARGTLYYHFKSKEDILDSIISRMTQKLAEKATAIADQKEIPVLRRLTAVIMALHVDHDLGHEILNQMHKPENALMHQKMQKELSDSLIPVLTGLVEEGNAGGVCNTLYPLEVVEMTFLYACTAFDDLAGDSVRERQRRIAAFIYNLERLLGMEEGSMRAVLLPVFGEAQPERRSHDKETNLE